MGKRILLVEGKDDQHVIWNLCKVRGVPETFTVECPELKESEEDAGGIENLLDSIPARLDTSDLECLAAVIDANDKGASARWQAIRDRLRNAGHAHIPETHSPAGTVVDLSDGIRFGVWVMPDNHSNGMIEDFVARMIREDDDMLIRVDDFLESIPEQKRRFTQKHQPKARIHSWLAVQKEPGKPMGQAIGTKKYLNADKAIVQPFLDWIKNALIN